MPIAHIQAQHDAPLLAQTLEAYLSATFPGSRHTVRVHSFDRLDVFNFITILAPERQHTSNTKRFFKLRVSAESPPRDMRKKPTPAIFDNALIIDEPEKFNGTGITGT